MNKWVVTLWACAAVWSGTSLYASNKIEKNYPLRVTELTKQSWLNLSIREQNFERGFLTNVATTVFEVKSNPCASEGVVFTVKETFTNDLVTGLGSIRSRIEIILADPKAEAAFNQIKKKINNKDSFSITGKYHLNGTVNYQLKSLPFVVSDNNTEMRSSGITGELLVKNQENSFKMDSPSFAITEQGKTGLVFSGMKIDNQNTTSEQGVETGYSKFSLASFEFNGTKSTHQLTAEDIVLYNEVKANGNLVNAMSENRIANLKLGNSTKNGGGSAKVALNNVDAQGLKTFLSALKKIQQSCNPNFADYNSDLKAVFKGQPEILFDHFKLHIGDMNLELGGHIKGLNIENIDNISTLTEVNKHIKDLDLRLNVKANDALIAELSEQKASFSSMADTLISINALKRNADGYMLDVTYKNNDVQLNNVPLNQIMESYKSALYQSSPYSYDHADEDDSDYQAF